MRRLRASWRECYLAAVLAGVVAYCLGPSLIGVRTLLSVNLLSNFYPWVAQHGNDLLGHNSCQGDTVDSVMPGIAHIRSSVLAGHLASWQSVVAGGAPLSGVPDLGMLDPLSLPYWILPLWLAPAFVVLLEFVVGIGGMFLFLRRLRISRPAAMLAGLIFVTSGFMVMWTNWPQVRVAALIPALFWAVERLIQRTRLVDAVLVALVVASMVFGGFPQVTGYALYLASGYLLVRLWVIHRQNLRSALRAIGLAAAGLITGILLSGVQLLPFVYFYGHSDLGYRSGDARQGLPLSGLLTTFAPNAYGDCVAGQGVRGSFNPVELIAYVGAAALVLAVAGAAFGAGRGQRDRRGVRGYFVAGALVIVLLGWASPTARSLVAGLPAFANNFIGRIRSVLGFSLAVLAAVGFDWLTASRPRRQPPASSRNSPSRRRHLLWAAVVWCVTAVGGVIVLRQAHEAAFSGHYWSALERTLWIPALLLAVTLGFLVVARMGGTRSQTFAFLVVPLLVAVQAAQFFHAVLPGDNKADFYPDTPTHQFLATNLGHDRFASANRTTYTPTALYYDLRTPTGHEFHEPQWEALLKVVDPRVMSTPTFSDFTAAINQTDVGSQPILDQMAVKYFVSPPSDLAGVVQPLPPTNGEVNIGPGTGTCTVPSGPVRGVTFKVARPLVASNRNVGVTLDMTVHSGDQTITSGRYMGGGVAAGTVVSVAVAGESLSPSSVLSTVDVRAAGSSNGLVLASVNGSVACAAVQPENDGLRLVHADPGSIIYQRLSALPRIRWASRSIEIVTADQRIAALKRGLPGDEVILDQGGPAASGQGATVSVLEDSGDTIRARVAAGGGGYLVVADAMQQPGWSVTVDGHPAHLVAADEAMVAVPVPAGVHKIAFNYTTPGQNVGALVSAMAILAIIVALSWTRVRRRREARASNNSNNTEPPSLSDGPLITSEFEPRR